MGKYSFKWWRLTICHPIRQLKKIHLIIVTFFTVLERCVQKQSDHCVQGAGVGGPYHMFTMEGLHRMWCSCQAWKCFHQTKPLVQLPKLHFLEWLAPYNYWSGYPGNHSSYQGTATMASTIVFGFGLGIRTVPSFPSFASILDHVFWNWRASMRNDHKAYKIAHAIRGFA